MQNTEGTTQSDADWRNPDICQNQLMDVWVAAMVYNTVLMKGMKITLQSRVLLAFYYNKNLINSYIFFFPYQHPASNKMVSRRKNL